jgi:hypothetical protein
MHEVLLSGQAERDLKRLPVETFQRVIVPLRQPADGILIPAASSSAS